MKSRYLVPIKYGRKKYPNSIIPKAQEIAGHFDVAIIRPSNMPYSLHTEYSYGKRKLNSDLIKKFGHITNSHKSGIPQLWFDKKWSREFCDFIKVLVDDNIPPKIIEIHPPFSDYCKSLELFVENYKTFENDILEVFPKTEIFIENRTGTHYPIGKFLLSSNRDIVKLSELISISNLKLRVVLDFPQLFTEHVASRPLSKVLIKTILNPIKDCKDFIAGLHIWGKRRNKNGRLVAHQGDLNAYFNNDMDLKTTFLTEVYNLFDDTKPRYFVPEVNSTNEDLNSIVYDFQKAGFEFI
jgi:hypothetical protein